MPGHVPDLDALFEKVEQAAHDAGWRMAEDGLEQLEHNVRINTPVETTHLRDSYKHTDILYGRYDPFSGSMLARGVHTLAYAWSGSVFTEVEYAPYVERGTGLWGPRHAKFMIKPKMPGGVLAFAPYRRMPNGGVILDIHSGSPSKGGVVYARYVMHPGSPGAEMFKIGTILTEAQKDKWSEAGLRLFNAQLQGLL